MELLTLNELKEAIQNGEINDYTPYIENDYAYRRFLLSQGICVDEILNYQDYPLLLDVINVVNIRSTTKNGQTRL